VTPYLVVLAAAFVTTVVLTPIVRWFALRTGAVVTPDPRRVHARPTPTLGGVAMVGGVLVGLAVAWRLPEFRPIFDSPTVPVGVALAAVVIFLVGLIDDVREVSAPAKVAGMVLAGSILTLAGVSTVFFRIPFGGILSLTPDLSAFITVLWVVGMANAINLIDGLDGLAAGITGIAAGSFFLYGLRLEQVDVLAAGNIGPLVAVITLGICIGFLPHNFHPARIFMGDSGALLLGLLMAASTMAVGGSTDAEYIGSTFFFFAPLVIPLVILGVPILDTVFAIVRRATRRSGLATADKEHLHHRLMRLGHGQRRSVLILWAWTALLSVVVLVPTYTGRAVPLITVTLIALALMLYTVFHPGLRRTRDMVDTAADETTELAIAGPEDETAPLPVPSPERQLAAAVDRRRRRTRRRHAQHRTPRRPS
jgi:UDP-GlcNAc:undecaprenyl-phosphate/decaprenyl-phosphate GlcNAc-1-phosphate transferase